MTHKHLRIVSVVCELVGWKKQTVQNFTFKVLLFYSQKPTKMPYSNFSTAQKMALAAMVIGSLMCLVGTGVPYWVVLNGNDMSVSSEVAEVDIGLWMYCGQFLGSTECKVIPWDDISGNSVVLALSVL